MRVKVLCFNSGAELPFRAHYNDAGADVYNPKDIYIANGQRACIPLGLGLELTDGFIGLIYTRSSMAKKGLTCELPPIDSGYRGEIHAIITNHSGGAVKLVKGDRIGQLVISPIIYAEYVTELGAKRGKGAFASTGV